MHKCLAELDLVFHALADPTRGSAVERLGRGSAATSELAQPFGMLLPSFTQHLGVLERCGLVASRKHGRVRTYALVPVAQRHICERRLDQVDAYFRDVDRQRRDD
jgi:DNA-binding transcriptional ArsR family regulator